MELSWDILEVRDYGFLWLKSQSSRLRLGLSTAIRSEFELYECLLLRRFRMGALT